MTLEDAIKKAEQETGGTVLFVDDCDDRWVFGFDFEADSTMGIVFCCFKNTGKFTHFFPPNEPDVLKRAKPIKLGD